MMKPDIDNKDMVNSAEEKNEPLDKMTMTKETIGDLLKQGYSKVKIAQIYGIDRTTLWRRMRQIRLCNR